jgi:hypothetical protein
LSGRFEIFKKGHRTYWIALRLESRQRNLRKTRVGFGPTPHYAGLLLPLATLLSMARCVELLLLLLVLLLLLLLLTPALLVSALFTLT